MIHLTKMIVDDTIYECSMINKSHHYVSDRMWSTMVDIYPLTIRDRIGEQIEEDLSYK